MSCLLKFIRLAKETATWLVGLGLVRTFLVRMPPRNYGEGSSASRFTTVGQLSVALFLITGPYLDYLPVVAESSFLDESRSDDTLVSRSFGDPPYTDSETNIQSFFICNVSRKRLL